MMQRIEAFFSCKIHKYIIAHEPVGPVIITDLKDHGARSIHSMWNGPQTSTVQLSTVPRQCSQNCRPTRTQIQKLLQFYGLINLNKASYGKKSIGHMQASQFLRCTVEKKLAECNKTFLSPQNSFIYAKQYSSEWYKLGNFTRNVLSLLVT